MIRAETMADPDPAFLSEQRAAWDSVAPGWSAWQHVFENGTAALSVRMVELLELAPGQRVLDLATGLGEPAHRAAQRVAPTGTLLALDLSAAMLARARPRLLISGARVLPCAADAERLPLPAASVDAATCRFGLMLMRDPVAVARGIATVLRRGGRLVAAVWGEPAEVPFLDSALQVLRERLQLAPFDPDAPGPCRLGKPGQLAGVLAAAGFTAIEVEPMTVTLAFHDESDYPRFLADLSSTTRRMLAEQSEQTRERVWQEILCRAIATHRSGARGLAFENRVYVARATAAG